MNSREYIDVLMSANDPCSDLMRQATTMEDYEAELDELLRTEEDHIRGDVEYGN